MACRSCRQPLASLSGRLPSSRPFLACNDAPSSSILSSRSGYHSARKLSSAPQRLAWNEIRPLSGSSSPLTDDGSSSSPSSTRGATRPTLASITTDEALASRKPPSALRQALASALSAVTPRTVQRYAVHRATQTLYTACSAQAEYRIDEGERREGTVRRTREGEEVGYAADVEGLWHRELNLLPTFSTWAQVTMLHLYLVTARLRCLPAAEQARSWQHQLVDHFFHAAEEAMDVRHGVRSSMLRQRYLKDLFVQWRGLTAAYDEGLVRGDAVLAAAVWRNLYKCRTDEEGEEEEGLQKEGHALKVEGGGLETPLEKPVQARHLAAVVAYMRASLVDLEAVPDDELGDYGRDVFVRNIENMLALVDRRADGMTEALDAMKRGQSIMKGTSGAE